VSNSDLPVYILVTYNQMR